MNDPFADTLAEILAATPGKPPKWTERWWPLGQGEPTTRDGGARKRFAYRGGKIVEIGFEEAPIWPWS